MVKMFHARRNPDPMQKKQIKESSKIVAEIMLKHMNINEFGTYIVFVNFDVV